MVKGIPDAAEEVQSEGLYDVRSIDRLATPGASKVVPTWLFGEPTLQSRNNGSVNWCKSGVSPLDQKSATGWLACLYGGVQSGWDDYARVEIPVNEMPIGDLTSALWSYYMTEEEAFGVNMVVWVHNPNDFDKRAEITQQADIATLEKAAGWDAHELDLTTSQFYFYGEGTTGTGLTAGPPNYYGMDDFQADPIFQNWTIYRISFEYGWHTGDNEFKDVWVADIKINGYMVHLKPDSSGTGRITHRHIDVDTGALALTLAPKTPWRLVSVGIHASAVLDDGEAFTATLDAGLGAHFDRVIYSDDLYDGSRTSQTTYFGEGYDFRAEDEMDFAQANGSNDDIGFDVVYQTVFA